MGAYNNSKLFCLRVCCWDPVTHGKRDGRNDHDDVLIPRLKTEAVAQFHQKGLDLIPGVSETCGPRTPYA